MRVSTKTNQQTTHQQSEEQTQQATDPANQKMSRMIANVSWAEGLVWSVFDNQKQAKNKQEDNDEEGLGEVWWPEGQ